MLNSVTGDVDSVSFDVVTPPPTPGVSSALACGTTGDSPSVYDSTNASIEHCVPRRWRPHLTQTQRRDDCERRAATLQLNLCHLVSLLGLKPLYLYMDKCNT